MTIGEITSHRVSEQGGRDSANAHKCTISCGYSASVRSRLYLGREGTFAERQFPKFPALYFIANGIA